MSLTPRYKQTDNKPIALAQSTKLAAPFELKLHNRFPITSKTINGFSPATSVFGKAVADPPLPPIY